jgi:myo-inositol-1(or 4)-monophosphatase
MHALLNIAVSAARKAGSFISRALERVDTLQVDSKGYNDFVSEVDRRAEQEIIQTIHKAYPHHAILAEESGAHAGNDSVWIIDPLDGTTNFLHGFPQFAVSVAMQHRGHAEVAVIYDPMRDELFTAIRGSGAQLNGRRLRVSKAKGLDGALIGTGFPFKDQMHIDAYLGMFRAVMPRAAGIRRAGSAALDLAYVAAGRLDGFWEIGLKPWDMAAGLLLIQEAGGIVGDFRGGADVFATGNVVAGNARVFEGLLAAIQPYVTPALQAGAPPAASGDAAPARKPLSAPRRRLTSRRANPRAAR